MLATRHFVADPAHNLVTPGPSVYRLPPDGGSTFGRVSPKTGVPPCKKSPFASACLPGKLNYASWTSHRTTTEICVSGTVAERMGGILTFILQHGDVRSPEYVESGRVLWGHGVLPMPSKTSMAQAKVLESEVTASAAFVYVTIPWKGHIPGKIFSKLRACSQAS